jgi:tRNA U38,U39,U40 pseudouridine synthase TruA
VGRGKLSVEDFEAILYKRDNQLADFSTPGHGLFLYQVYFPVSVLRIDTL